ncbi:hypothetical protein Pint_27851 [Pistacia integerrima]|uniref:Uncharacterized protein n=1 Tax=Pistacia integerrima TaxID=434235 RepID=A0ACC0YRR0_9ROSI|nr:hypothetical protein Pint_27851 [Pistacia integerrima]
MSHRKVHSQGSVPFSWEDKPGVSRISREDCSSDKGLHAFHLASSTSLAPADSNTCNPSVTDIKIPLPPCPSQQLGLIGWWQEDPFLAAYKECTKNARRSSVGSKLPRKKSKFIFSCKNSCEVREDNLVRLSNLPPLPKERIRRYR